MPSFKLPVAAALASLAAFAVPASANTVVHHQRVVTHTEVGHAHHGVRKVCKNYWRNHKRIHRCRTVRWDH